MSWDGLYAREREYPDFNIGDEVFTVKKYGGLIKRKGYIVTGCSNPYNHLPESNVRHITLLNEFGKEERYGSYRFKKTERQLREDKINQIINK